MRIAAHKERCCYTPCSPRGRWDQHKDRSLQSRTLGTPARVGSTVRGLPALHHCTLMASASPKRSPSLLGDLQPEPPGSPALPLRPCRCNRPRLTSHTCSPFHPQDLNVEGRSQPHTLSPFPAPALSATARTPGARGWGSGG